MLPTLLVKGSLRTPSNAGDVSPIHYIVAWLKKRMPEFGGRGADLKDRVLIVQSETGSGKSTVLPVYVFRILRSEATPRGRKYAGPSVLCTQPRVLTAIDLAQNQVGGAPWFPDMALGATVGYQTGPFSEKPPAGLVFATIGILAAQLRTMEDAAIMAKYRFIIVDEAHERSKEADATLLRLKNFYTRNAGNERLPFLILASATISLQKYATFFGVGPENTVHVEGRTYPINTHWPDRGSNDYPRDSARLAITIHEKEVKDPPERADILIFVPGDAEIAAVREILEAWLDENAGAPKPPFLLLEINRAAIVEKSPHFRLISERPDKLPDVNGRRPARRIVVSTVVAETGLTIATLRHVIDCGWSRNRETYQPYAASGLITRPAPQSRIKQRKGRCGRMFPGEFYPMYTKNVYESLDVQQLPDIATGGLTDIILDIIGEQQRQKALLKTRPEFRVEDIELIGAPPADALLPALGAAAMLGFTSRCADLGHGDPTGEVGYGLTALGQVAGKFSRIPPAPARAILAAYIWGVSARDMITVAAVAATPLSALLDREFVRQTKGAKQWAALRDALPPFLAGRWGGVLSGRRPERGGAASDDDKDVEKTEETAATADKPQRGVLVPPTDDEAFLYRARLLLADDFIEMLLVFDSIMGRLERAGDAMHLVAEYCRGVGIDVDKLLEVMQLRETMFEDVLAAGLDPYHEDDKRLALATQQEFIRRVTGIKRCIYDGFRLGLLRYDAKENVYADQYGLRVEVPPGLADAELRKLRAAGVESPRKPTYIVTSSIELGAAAPDATGARPIMYKPRALSISMMDGYVDIDPGFTMPTSCTATESKTAQSSDPEARIRAYNKACQAALGTLCPPVFSTGAPLFGDLTKLHFDGCNPSCTSAN